MLSDDDFSEDEAEMADKHHARSVTAVHHPAVVFLPSPWSLRMYHRNALFKTMRRARRRAEKAAAQKEAGKQETVKEKPKEAAAPQKYVSWRVRQARMTANKDAGKPPKMDDPNDFPSLGGCVARAVFCP